MYFKKCDGPVCIETPSEEQLEYIMHLWADEHTMRDVGGTIKMSSDRMHDWFKKVIKPGDGTHCYTLILYENEPVGEVSFHRYERDQGTAEFNIKVEHCNREKGIASRAANLLLDIFFNNYMGREMRDKIAVGNIGAEILLTKLGFVHSPELSDSSGKMFIKK